jgi:hypothetical protein
MICGARTVGVREFTTGTMAAAEPAPPLEAPGAFAEASTWNTPA